MNKIWTALAVIALNLLSKALSKMDDAKIKEISDKINKKIDIPKLSEETEGRIIYNTLDSIVKVTKELLNVVRI